MTGTRAALALLALLLGGCVLVDRSRTIVPVEPWTEAARRCYERDLNRVRPLYNAAYRHVYEGRAYPGRVWLVGRAACDAFVDEKMAEERRQAVGLVPPLPAAPVPAVPPLARPDRAPPTVPGTPPPSGPPSAAESVTAPPPTARPAPREFTPIPELRTIYFDFDRAVIRADARAALDATAEWLKANPRVLLLIEGHCDERGTDEYNLALGERRARAARDYLVARGVRGDRITTISYGEELPVCTESNEDCWQQNRRAEFLRRVERE